MNGWDVWDMLFEAMFFAGGTLAFVLACAIGLAISAAILILYGWALKFSLEFWSSYVKKTPVRINLWFCVIASLVLYMLTGNYSISLLAIGVGTWLASFFINNPFHRNIPGIESVATGQQQPQQQESPRAEPTSTEQPPPP